MSRERYTPTALAARLAGAANWTRPSGALRIATIDAHAAGEPLRIIIRGYPDLPGKTMLARRRYAGDTLDHLRKALMWEPRGHADMYGCLITEPVTGDADFGVIFMHNQGYSTMCGHGIIGVATVAVVTGIVERTEPTTRVGIDTPAGFVTATAHVTGRDRIAITFRNVPSFVVALDAKVDVPGLRRVQYDLAFGGAYYAYVEAASVGVRCTPDDVARQIEIGTRIKRAIANERAIDHPYEVEMGFLYGVIFTGPAVDGGAHSRNVCVFADGEVDRSPTGTGVSGRAAIAVARGELRLGERITIESVIGTTFTVEAVEKVTFGGFEAIVPQVGGTAHITGRHEFVIDPLDPLRTGFLLGR